MRDRHGRARRGDGDPRRRPSDGFRVRDAQRFRRVAAEAIAGLPERFRRPVNDVEIHVQDVPPPPMITATGDVVLAALEGGRLVLYRRAIEARADNRTTLEDTLAIAIAQAVARRMGFDDDVDGLLD